jgi:hypothetical protein
LLFTFAELPQAARLYNFGTRIAQAKRRDMWVGSYVEVHIWDPDVKATAGANR